eukprot:TRINITY_DN16963_c1_g2_i3.p1 TRINITY_DN16963_c1_g2~~TRINITY_DN16963_c1_g2_i3.p1  ORF type:complete len:458 (+),score=94.05 TRINITY_DN16963_c1_g2_i3:155-1375(+)
MWLVQVATVACAAGDVMLGPYADWPPAWLGGGGQPAEGARGEDGITGKPQGGGGQPAEGAPHGADSRGEGRAGGARERSDPPGSHCDPCQACPEKGERDGPQQSDGSADGTFLDHLKQWWEWFCAQKWLPAVVAFSKQLWWLSTYVLWHLVTAVSWVLQALCALCGCCCCRGRRRKSGGSPRAAAAAAPRRTRRKSKKLRHGTGAATLNITLNVGHSASPGGACSEGGDAQPRRRAPRSASPAPLGRPAAAACAPTPSPEPRCAGAAAPAAPAPPQFPHFAPVNPMSLRPPPAPSTVCMAAPESFTSASRSRPHHTRRATQTRHFSPAPPSSAERFASPSPSRPHHTHSASQTRYMSPQTRYTSPAPPRPSTATPSRSSGAGPLRSPASRPPVPPRPDRSPTRALF